VAKQKAAKKADAPAETRAAGEPAADVTELPVKRHDGARFMLTLSAEATKLLDTACLVEGRKREAILEELITTDLAGYYAGKTEAGEPGGFEGS
jgi:hypothetical protein